LFVALVGITALMIWYANTNNGQPANNASTVSLESEYKTSASIAVLAFEDMSPEKDQEYFCDGISEEILNTLAQLEELKVAGRTSSFYFKNKSASIPDIGKALNVDYVLEGSVRKQGDAIRITAQLIKVSSGFHTWSKTYDRDFTDLFAIQDELAQTIGEALLVEIAPEQLVKLTTSSTRNSEAFNLFLKGKHIHRTRYIGSLKEEEFKICEGLFKEALKLDSTFALAHAGLADLYDTRTNYVPDDTATTRLYDSLKMKESEIAIQLGPNHAYVQLVRGWALKNRNFTVPDYENAFNCFLKAYQLNPNATDGLEGLASFYIEKDLAADAVKFYDKAISLNITNPYSYVSKAAFLVNSGQFQAAIKTSNTALEFDPENIIAHKYLALSYFYLRDTVTALSIYERMTLLDSAYIKNSRNEQLRIALLKGEIEVAESINPKSGDLLFYTQNDEEFKRIIIERTQRSKEHNKYSQQSKYISFSQNPILEKFKTEPWFLQILKEEKSKYDLFYSKYPRAEEILK
jgi:TolB-like protein/Tfp pilus assembly protein PilF